MLAALALAWAGCGETPRPAEPELEVQNSLEPGTVIEALASNLGVPRSFEGALGRFVLVPAGQFTMGSPSSEPGRRADETLHAVALRSPFYLMVSAGDALPFAEAAALAARLSAEDPEHTYRLPTEAEWEFACRAGATGAVPNARALGLRGMGLGTREWCADWYAGYPPQAVADPIGPDRGERRVARGLGRCAAREPALPSETAAVRLVAEVGYRGRVAITFRSVVRDPDGHVEGDVPGLRLRVISILDRLSDRQAGRREEWTDVAGRTPFTLHMRPGRYYAYVYEVGNEGERRGNEQKLAVESDPHDVLLDVP